jgi:hypothetical protein
MDDAQQRELNTSHPFSRDNQKTIFFSIAIRFFSRIEASVILLRISFRNENRRDEKRKRERSFYRDIAKVQSRVKTNSW